MRLNKLQERVLILVMFMYFISSLYLGLQPTGFVTFTRNVKYVDNLDMTFDTDTEFVWTLN
jgi:hypothetical protein